MLCSGSLYAAVLLACWGFILYGVYARFGQEKSRSRSPEKFMQVSMTQSHLHNAMTSLWANREKDGRIRRLHFARAQTLLYKRGGKT